MPAHTLSRILTQSHITSLPSNPRIPAQCWYYIAGVTLSALNQPDEIPAVYRAAVDDANARELGDESEGRLQDETRKMAHIERQKVVDRMRDGLVKSAAVVGLPKLNVLIVLSMYSSRPNRTSDLPATWLDVDDIPIMPSIHTTLQEPTPTSRQTINALVRLSPSSLSNHPSFHPSTNPPPPPSPTPPFRSPLLDLPASTVLRRGTILFDKTYGKVAERVMSQMETTSGAPDLGLLAKLMYGYILGGGEDVLKGKEISWVLIAGLIPQDVNPQLKGHLRGALNHGASFEEVRGVREAVVEICEAFGMHEPDDSKETRRLENGSQRNGGEFKDSIILQRESEIGRKKTKPSGWTEKVAKL